MRWPVFFIFAYIMLGLQIGISRYVEFHGAGPNLGLLAVLFVSLNARRDSALLGSFAIGLTQDLLTGQPLGLFAFSYGLISVAIVASDQLVNRSHPLTHFSFALIAGLILTFIVLIHSAMHPASPAVGDGKAMLRPIRISASTEFVRAFYTAILAPLVMLVLHRTRSAFALQPGRRSARW